MAVKTKSIYEPAAPKDGVRVLITRYYPRGVKKDRFDQWVKPLSPSRGLLSSYRDGRKSWDQFKGGFIEEMKSSKESREALRMLGALSQGRDVTLLCYEKPGVHCHRQVVQEILAKPDLLSEYLERMPEGGASTGPTRKSRSSEARRGPRTRRDGYVFAFTLHQSTPLLLCPIIRPLAEMG